jgi:hypothetical protein
MKKQELHVIQNEGIILSERETRPYFWAEYAYKHHHHQHGLNIFHLYIYIFIILF